MRHRALALCFLFASPIVALTANAPPYALENARIVTMAGPVIESGTLVMRDGRIVSVGADAVSPVDAIVIDATGWTLYPGFIDAHSAVGMPDGERESARQAAARRERGEPVPGLQANVRAAAIYEHDADTLRAYRAAGVAVAAIAPKDGILRGQSAVITLGDGRVDELIVREPWAQHVGLTPFSRQRNDYPGTLMGVLATIRQRFLDARWYDTAWERYHETPDALERPAFDESLEALGTAARNEQPVVFSAWSDNAILRTLRLANELSVDAVVSGASGGWRVADVLAESALPVLVSLDQRPRSDPAGFGRQDPSGLMPNPGKADRKDVAENPRRLHEAGVTFALTSQGLESTDLFLANMRNVVASGLPQDAALEALTTTPARFLGLAASAGSLEVGKAAHVVAVEGDLFDDGHVRATWVDGRLYENDAEPPKTAAAADDSDDDTPDLRERWENTAPKGPHWPEAPVTAIRNATLLTVTNGTVEDGTIIIKDGRITELGPSSAVQVPGGAREIDAAGMFAMPGIVDAHIHIALSGGGNESTRAVTPEVRIADIIDHRSPSILRALAGGVTTVNVLHGSANVIGGQNAVLKLRWGKNAADLFFEGAKRGVKFALGENPKQINRRRPDGVPPRYPATRMGVELTLRTSFAEARAYQSEWQTYEAARERGEDPMPPRRDLRLDALVDILEGRILVHAHCYRSDEILMLLRVAEDFGFEIASLQHVLEGYKVADEIAAYGAGASTFADGWGYKMEAFDAIPYNAALMASRGVTVSINSDAVGEMRKRLYLDAAKAVKYGGVSEAEALAMVTLNPAKHFQIDDRVGSLEVGKDADIALFTAHPFSADAEVRYTLIDGQVYFDKDKVQTVDDALPALATDRHEPEKTKRSLTYKAWHAPAASPLKPEYGDASGPSFTKTGVVAIQGATIHTMAGPTIENGTIVVRDGRIAAVGTGVAVPASAHVIDARGLVVTPGVINAGTTLGISEINAVGATQDVREVQSINSSVKASVAVHPHSEMIPVTRVNGVTTAVSAPSGGLISGQAALLDLYGWTAPEVVAKSPIAMVVQFPEHLTLSPDENARKRVQDERQTIRDWMRRARAFAGSLADGASAGAGDEDELRALVPVVRRDVPVLIQADSEEGIRAALRFADELELDMILQGTRDVWRTVDALAAARVPVVLGPIESRPAPGDPYDAIHRTAKLLIDAGVPFCFRTGGATNARNLPYHAGLAVAHGLSRQQAWHAMTKGAADIFGVGELYGTIEVGKVANLVVADGDLLDVPTQVRHVLVRGHRIELTSRHTILYEKFNARPRPTTRGTDANP